MKPVKHILLVAGLERRERVLQAAAGLGAEFHCFEDCAAAAEFLAAGPRPDLVVTDLTLPDGNWWTLCSEIARSFDGTPVVVALPHPTSDVTELLRHGAAAVLQPPFEPAHVRETLAEALEKAIPSWASASACA